MKNWSLGKLLGVTFGGLFAVLGGLFLVLSIINSSSNSAGTSKRILSSQESVDRDINKVLGPDIVSVQLESTQEALRQAQEDNAELKQFFKEELNKRDQELAVYVQALTDQIKIVAGRVSALEEDRILSSDVAVTRNEEQGIDDESKPKKESTNKYVPPKGFVVRAKLGDRVWISDGKRELSVLINESEEQ